MDESARIYKYLDLADRSGKRFAYKNGKYEPECIAEARYILTHTVLVENELLNKAENEEIFLKIVISRRLRTYFQPKYHSERVGIPIKDMNVDPTDEVSLIDEIESLYPGHEDIFKLWREGFDINDLIFLNRNISQVGRDLLKVKRKLQRSHNTREAKINAYRSQLNGQLVDNQTRKSA